MSVNFFSCAVALAGRMRSKGMSSTCRTAHHKADQTAAAAKSQHTQ
jgi:hypothetical protein